MNCDCLNTVDSKLREKNLRLACFSWMLPSFTPVVTLQTEWVNPAKAPKGRKRQPTKIHASHCPFCGVKIKIPQSGSTNQSGPVAS